MEALSAIFVQHGEVITAAYTTEIGIVVVTDVATVNSNLIWESNVLVSESDIPDSAFPIPVKLENIHLVESECKLYGHRISLPSLN